MTLLIGIPAYQGVEPASLHAFLALLRAYPKAHHMVLGNCPWLDLARAELLAVFLATPEASHMLCLDGDIAVGPRVVEDLLAADRPVLSAPYRQRFHPHAWACVGPGGDLANVERFESHGRRCVRGLVRAGLGCTLIRRDAAEALTAAYPELRCRSLVRDGAMHAVFTTMIVDGEPYPEDAAFFLRMQRLGIGCELLWDAEVSHAGIRSNLATSLPWVTPQGLEGKVEGA